MKKKQSKKTRAFGHTKTTIEVLDGKINNLHRATKSDFSLFAPWHIELCRRSSIYYEWHKNELSESIHWMIMTLLILYSLLVIFKGNLLILTS